MTQCDWMIGICWYIISFSKWNYYSRPIHTNKQRPNSIDLQAGVESIISELAKMLTITSSQNTAAAWAKISSSATSHLSIGIGSLNCLNWKSFTLRHKILCASTRALFYCVRHASPLWWLLLQKYQCFYFVERCLRYKNQLVGGTQWVGGVL